MLKQNPLKKEKFNFLEIKSQFPIFNNDINGNPLIYLDSAASSQKPKLVLDSLNHAYSKTYSNVHRGLHFLSETSTDAFEEVRVKVANFLNVTDQNEIIFTSGATMSLNMIANCYGFDNLKSDDEILISIADHHANIVPWQILSKKIGCKIVAVPINNDGSFNIDDLKSKITKNTKIISFPHVSNVLGTIFPVKKISEIAKDIGAISIIDGCQSVPHINVDIQDIGCDFYVFSGHKIYGPSGIGICWGKKSILDNLPPFLGGGDMIENVEINSSTYADPPYRFEAGTPPIVECIGLGAAIDFVNSIGINNIRNHEIEILNYGHDVLSKIKGLKFVGETEDKSGVISFTLDNVHPHDISTLIDQDGIAIRAGHHCAQPLMKFLNLNSTARASVAIYNEKTDFDKLCISLEKVKRIFSDG